MHAQHDTASLHAASASLSEAHDDARSLQTDGFFSPKVVVREVAPTPDELTNDWRYAGSFHDGIRWCVMKIDTEDHYAFENGYGYVDDYNANKDTWNSISFFVSPQNTSTPIIVGKTKNRLLQETKDWVTKKVMEAEWPKIRWIKYPQTFFATMEKNNRKSFWNPKTRASHAHSVHFEEVGGPLHVDGCFGLTGKSKSKTAPPASAKESNSASFFSKLIGPKKTAVSVPKKPTDAQDVTNLSNASLFTKVFADSLPWLNAKNQGSQHYAILPIFDKKHYIYMMEPLQHHFKFDTAGRRTEVLVNLCVEDITTPVVFENILPTNKEKWIERRLIADEYEQLVYIKNPTEFFKSTLKTEANVMLHELTSASRNAYIISSIFGTTVKVSSGETRQEPSNLEF
jgi:hypothetical protein